MKLIKGYISLFGLLLMLILVTNACGDDDQDMPGIPVLTDQSFSVAEDINDETIIGVVQASDPDGDAISFTITGTVEIDGNRDFSGLFEIDENSGALSLTDGEYLDFEDASGFSVTVSVSDTEFTATATVTIMVTDVKEGSIPFVTTWTITQPPQTIRIDTRPGLEYNYNINWGDGTVENGLTAGATHTFTDYGFFRVSITGTFPAIDAKSSPALRSIDQWGNIEWHTMEEAFTGCVNLEEKATDAPNLLRVTEMQGMFSNCRDFKGDLNNWDVGKIINMSSLFENITPFEGDIAIGNWDVGNVTNMSKMFKGAVAFNQDIGNWDVGKVTDMHEMFGGASAFNQDLGDWDVSKVTDMQGMFSNARTFNGDISNWDVSKVTNMRFMFRQASVFNQDIGSWNVGNVTDMHSMFSLANAFNQDIGNWDVSKVSIMFETFSYTSAFNQDIGNWDVSSVVRMTKMFARTQAFDQDIGEWNVSNVTDMRSMFLGAQRFNQDIGNWDVSKVADFSFMFHQSTAFNQDLTRWNVTGGCNGFARTSVLEAHNLPNFVGCNPF